MNVMSRLKMTLIVSGAVALVACSSQTVPLPPMRAQTQCKIERPVLETKRVDEGIWMSNQSQIDLLKYIADLEQCAGVE